MREFISCIGNSRRWHSCVFGKPCAVGLRLFGVLVAGLLGVVGCSDWLGSSRPKTYSGGGPLPEESEVLENLKKKPPIGRYAPEPTSPRPVKVKSRRRPRGKL